MGDYQTDADVNAPAEALYDYLADVGNLPKYFDGMVSAEPAGDEAVHVVARVEGTEREGEAWLHRDSAAKHLAWGSEGPNNYHGELDVTANTDNTSRVTVYLHTTQAEGHRIQDGLERSLANIKRLVETQASTTR